MPNIIRMPKEARAMGAPSRNLPPATIVPHLPHDAFAEFAARAQAMLRELGYSDEMIEDELARRRRARERRARRMRSARFLTEH